MVLGLSATAFTLPGCGADPVTAPLVVAPAVLNAAARTATFAAQGLDALGQSMNPAPTPPTNEQTLVIMRDMAQGRKKYADLNPEEQRAVATMMARMQRDKLD